MGCKKITAHTRIANAASANILTNAGLRVVKVLPDYYADKVDALFWSTKQPNKPLKDNWRGVLVLAIIILAFVVNYVATKHIGAELADERSIPCQTTK